MTADDAPTRERKARRFVLLARLTLAWERLWPALWPASGFLGLYGIAALFGLFTFLPPLLHLLVLLALFGTAGFLLWRSFAPLRPPRWEEAARRVERDSGLVHRPLTEGADTLAAGRGDALAENLWRTHLIRLLASAERLVLLPPAPRLARRDPRGLRFLVLLGLLAGLAVAGRDAQDRLAAGLSPAFSAGSAIALNAWISPPAYTGQPPHAISTSGTGPVAAPRGSILILRVRSTAVRPQLGVHPTPPGGAPEFVRAGGGYEAKVTLAADGGVAVRESGRTLGEWRFAILPDRRPSIAFSEPPSPGPHDTLKLAYKADDDYGVTKIEARIALAGSGNPPAAALGLGPFIAELPLPAETKQFSQTVYRDLTAHPYAGLKVTIQLVATDAAGQTGSSAPMTLVLPERVFAHPLARALIEQRKLLATGKTGARQHARAVVDALTIAPERFYKNDFRTYLAMRALYWQLGAIRDQNDVLAAVNFMWDLALALEEGGAAGAAEDLRTAQQALMDALERGASDEEIAALMEKLRQALGRYLQAMAQNAGPGGAPPPGAKTLKPEDLETILKAIEDYARTGARDAARQLLAGLAQLLENLTVTNSGQASPNGQALSDAVQGLSDLMGAQRELLDRTFREQQRAQAGSQQGLANDQRALKDRLAKIIEGLRQKGVAAPKELGGADDSMQSSQQGLKAGHLPEAGQAEQNALEQLRRGAEALANQLMPQSNGTGENGQMPDDRDPLGRPLGGSGPDFGNSVRVPQESELQRAREILDELRRRAAERNRAREELDYIERLLKQF